jgi:DNA-binding GntR family transcriptional regulator
MQVIQLPGRQSRAAELYEHLRRSIVAGEFQEGDRMVEEQIAAMASVSRTPVREALRRLESDGLVQITSRGVIVTLATHDQMIEFCVVREALEGMAARFAANSRTELELETMRELHHQCETASLNDQLPGLVEVNSAFHEAIWQAARNRYLMQQLRFLRTMVHRLQATTLDRPDRRAVALQEHKEILDAIAAGDADRAEELARLHHRRATSIRMARMQIK